MTGFVSPWVHLATNTREERGERFILRDPLEYVGSQGDVWTVPAGFVTDLASVPRWATWMQPRYGLLTGAAVLHDYLCRIAVERPVLHGDGRLTLPAGTPWLSRHDADGLFRRELRAVGLSWPRRWVLWGAVRVDGLRAGGLEGTTWGDVWRLLLLLLCAPVVLLPALPVAVWQTVGSVIEWALRPRGTA